MTFRLSTGRISFYMSGLPIYNEVFGEELKTFGTDRAVEIKNDGLTLKTNQYLEAKMVDYIGSSFADDISFGFSLISNHPGFAEGSTAANLLPIYMPVINLSDHTLSPYTGDYLPNQSLFMVYESTFHDGRNRMHVEMNTEGGNSFTITTDPYDVGVLNFFWFTYQAGSEDFRAFINGEQVTYTKEGNYLVPLPVLENTKFSINKYVPQSLESSHIRNTGRLDDIVVLAEAENDAEILQRFIEGGAEWAFDSAVKSKLYEADIPLLLNDPNTLTIKKTIFDGNKIYLARDDGRLDVGFPLLWDREYLFSGVDEETISKNITLYENASGGISFPNKEGIKVSNGMISVE